MDSTALDVTAAPPPATPVNAAADVVDVTTLRSARRVTACERLTPEHAVQRQRATDEPILVAWKVERRANGQELISISSDESSDGDEDDDEDNEEDEEKEEVGADAEDLNGSCTAAASGGENDNDDEDYEYTSECEADLLSTAEEQQHDQGDDSHAKSNNSAVAEQKPKRKRENVVIDVDEDSDGGEMSLMTTKPNAIQQPMVYSIDSEDSDSDGGCEIVERPLSADNIADARAIAEAREREREPFDQAFEFSAESADIANADCNTTPEATTDSSCEADTRIKCEAVEQLLALKAEPPTAIPIAVAVATELTVRPESPVSCEPVTAGPAAAAHSEEEDAKVAPVVKPEPTSAVSRVVVVPKKVIPLMRRKKLDEEDAAFLLFYGISEAPTARILGLIIEYIDRCVGESSAFVARCTKFLLWCKMNTHVNAGIEAERLARSEWMKIVFSSEDPSMRPEIYRSTLLPRPVRITVRPLKFVRRRAYGGGYMMTSRNSDALVSPKRVKGKQAGVYTPQQKGRVNGLVLNGVLQQLSPPTQTVDFREQTVPHTNTLKHRKQPPQSAAKTKKRKAEKITVSAVPDSPLAQSPIKAVPYTPRKHRRRNGSITLYDIELPIRGKAKNGGLPKSSEALRPLTSDQVTAGINRSLPHGRSMVEDGIEEGLKYRRGPCVQVCPLQNMSAEDLKSHINSVHSEGRIKSFEKLSDIISKLMADPRNYRGLFNAPVDPVTLNLPTYTSIIKNPMDLGTVKKRLAEGKYIETQDFANDVRLVFENAKLFNEPKHSVHLCADTLLRHFERELKSGLQKRNPGPKHACGACYGHTCVLCDQLCLPFAQPHLQCSGSCGTDIRKGSIYYIARDGTRVWCHKCRNRLVREKAGLMSNGSSQSLSFSQSSSIGGSQLSVDDDTEDSSMVRMKCDTTVEPWVKCSECARWMHQVCGLFNPVRGAYALEHDFVCPLCCWRQKSSAPSPSSSLHNLLNPASNDHEASKSTCLNIPPCELSTFIQSFLRAELEAIGEGEAAQTLNVRVLSFPGEKMAIPETVVRAFDENASALKYALPEREVAHQQLPAEVTFLSRGIYLFQKHDGVDVSLFTLYAQEFGESCELAANRKAVYIAYIDSIRYLKPASARTSAYHFIMLAYFDYIRRHGFERVHIWSCPPQKRISYVFWCRPAFQKTPGAEHLRSWYNRLLEKAKSRKIVQGWTTLYDRYLAHEDTVLPEKYESQQHLIATRGVTSRSVDPGDLAWPVSELPPIFDGDFIPAELDRILGRIGARNGKIRRADELVKNASIGSSGGKRAKGDAIKEDPDGPMAAAAATQQQPPNVEFKLREVFDKLKFSVQRMKQDLLVVHLAAVDTEDSTMTVACRPETTVPEWCQRVPRFFGSRFMFHQLCANAGYQFDSLRRAKHSTMMILHHYFNEHVTQVNVFCLECSLLITHAEYWACQTCDRFALCDACFQRHGHTHDHVLQYGRQLQVAHSPPPVQSRGHQQQQIQHSEAMDDGDNSAM